MSLRAVMRRSTDRDGTALRGTGKRGGCRDGGGGGRRVVVSCLFEELPRSCVSFPRGSGKRALSSWASPVGLDVAVLSEGNV